MPCIYKIALDDLALEVLEVDQVGVTTGKKRKKQCGL